MVTAQVEGATGIGGSPGVVEDAARQLEAAASTMTTVGQDVGRHGDGVVQNWRGSAADAAHERIRHLSQRTDVGAEVVSELPAVLETYATELRAAQEAYTAGVAAAATARAALSTARDAVASAAALDVADAGRVEAMRLSGQGERYARDGVDAASDAIDAAVAREALANQIAARAVEALTGRLSGMDPTVPGGAPPISVRSVEDAEGHQDEGRPLTWIERTATDVVETVVGGLDTAYLVPQAFGYGLLRLTGSDHDEAVERLERDHEWLQGRAGVDTESPYYEALDVRDEWGELRRGSDTGGGREVVGALGQLAWEGGPGAVSLGLGLSPFEQDRQIGAKIDAVHDRLEDEWGTQTDSKVYRGVLLAGLLVPSHSERRGVEGIAGAVGSSAGAVGKHQAQQGHSTPLPRTVADLPPAPAGSTAQTWGQVGTLDYHAKKHGSDFGLADRDRYALGANEFRRRAGDPNIEVKLEVQKDGSEIVRMYDPSTNTFGSYNGDGTTRTFFKPTSTTYWGRQRGNMLP